MRSRSRSEKGFTLVEMLISLLVMLLAMMALASFLIQNAQANKAQQMTLATQASARNCMSMIQAVLRNAGWDPRNVGIAAVALDPTPTGPDNYIEVFADLNGNMSTADDGEDVTIRHHDNAIEWKRTAAATSYVVLAEDITNDADEDGTIEPLFTPDSTTNPKRVTVRITARSPLPDPASGKYIVYTISSDVVLRGRL